MKAWVETLEAATEAEQRAKFFWSKNVEFLAREKSCR
jgi:hypothetical protein